MPALRSYLVWSLTACILLVAAAVYPQTVPHAIHHAHHNAATHASVLCTWLCAAGQGLESSHVILQAELSPLSLLIARSPEHYPSRVLFALTARGPPFGLETFARHEA